MAFRVPLRIFDEMVASPDVDIVAVTVKVPAHWDIVRAALECRQACLLRMAAGPQRLRRLKHWRTSPVKRAFWRSPAPRLALRRPCGSSSGSIDRGLRG